MLLWPMTCCCGQYTVLTCDPARHLQERFMGNHQRFSGDSFRSALWGLPESALRGVLLRMPGKGSRKCSRKVLLSKRPALSGALPCERWLVSIYKEIESFLQNMAIEDADPSLAVKWKSSSRWPRPCQMLFVLKPLTQSQQTGEDVQADYKHKS